MTACNSLRAACSAAVRLATKVARRSLCHCCSRCQALRAEMSTKVVATPSTLPVSSSSAAWLTDRSTSPSVRVRACISCDTTCSPANTRASSAACSGACSAVSNNAVQGRPMASVARQPKHDSAAGFQAVILPLISVVTTASPACATKAAGRVCAALFSRPRRQARPVASVSPANTLAAAAAAPPASTGDGGASCSA